jgi:predicted O-methyltransferase YrrM
VSNKVEVREGDALAALQQLAGSSFDLVFVDADKQSYPRYLSCAMELTRPGSIIVADNVWHAGAVVEPPPDDEINRGLRAFNEQLAAESRLLTTFFATRDCHDAASISIRL